jgi:hypothetical protein
MRRLMPGSQEIRVLDKPQITWNPMLFWTRTRVLGRYAFYPHAHCPACGHADFSAQRSDPVRRVMGGINRVLTRGRTIPGGHILALYDLHGTAAAGGAEGTPAAGGAECTAGSTP